LRAGRDSRGHIQAGFTLFELIVVLLIVAIGSAFIAPAISSGLESRQVRQGTRKLAGIMRGLREQAVRRGIEQELVLEPDGQNVTFGDGQTVTLPEGVEIEGVRGGWRDEDGSVRVIFYPNGGTTGVALLIAGPSRSGLKFGIDVDPLLGSVVVRDARDAVLENG
jgi:prepilin-type N-terminal cleavage/methylation domain-containing protein